MTAAAAPSFRCGSGTWHMPSIWLAAFAITAALFWPDRTLLDGGDWVRMHIFYKSYYREALLDGRLPLWNPFSGLGRPFLADAETATLYPLNLVYLLGIGTGLVASLVLHFALLLRGMLGCARRLGCANGPAWFGAFAFALGAPLIGRLQSGQLQVFCTLCWLPLVLDLGCALQDKPGRKELVRFSIAFALMFLAGSPPLFWVCTWCILLFLFVRHPTAASLRWIIPSGLLAGGLVAVQAIPFLELVREGNRSLRDPSVAIAYAEELGSWTSLIRSRTPTAFFNWEYNLYMGLPVVLFAVLSIPLWHRPVARPVVAIGFVFTLLAIGGATPVLPWLAAHVPGWGAFRLPARYAIITAFAIALLAAVGLQYTSTWLRSKSTKMARWVSIGICTLVALNVMEALRALTERSNIYSGQPLSLKEDAISAALKDAGLFRVGMPPPRLMAPRGIVRENSGLIEGYSTLASFSNPMIGRVWESLHLSAGAEALALEPIFLSPLVYTAEASRFRGTNLGAHWDQEQSALALDAASEPRVFTTYSARMVDHWREANQQIAAGHPFRAVALIESEMPTGIGKLPSVPTPQAGADPAILNYEPERIRVQYTGDRPSLVVFSEAWFPGWEAAIDGKSATVIPVNGWMRAVPVPAGEHKIDLRFRPGSLALGASISFIACAVCCLIWFIRPKHLHPT